MPCFRFSCFCPLPHKLRHQPIKLLRIFQKEEMLPAFVCLKDFQPRIRNLVGDPLHRAPRHKADAPADDQLVLVNMGGMQFRPPMERWPRLPGVHWLVQQDWQVQHADAHAFESLNLAFTDLLASCDAVIGKPGYGLFTEAAINGVPLLYLSREDWPEESYLVDWLARHGRCREVSAAAISSERRFI